MGELRQCLLAAALLAGVLAPAAAPRFFPDDPLWRLPPPLPVENVQRLKSNLNAEVLKQVLVKPGERSSTNDPVPAVGVNTLGEVPDGYWFTNRHGRRRLSRAELQRGPGNATPPSSQGKWTVIAAKNEGVTPGFTIQDETGRRYLLKFDPPEYPGLASGTDVIGSKFFWAIGYNTPENYVVRFRPERLAVSEKARFRRPSGNDGRLSGDDLRRMLATIGKEPDGTIRAAASLYVKGEPIGAFSFYGTRPDDPNDIELHEHRRDLRGLRVFAAWLNHTDAKSLNSLDVLVTDPGPPHIRHYLIDFGSILGSDSIGPKSPRNGYTYTLPWKQAAGQLLSLGLYVPDYGRTGFPGLQEIGNIEAEKFDPDHWVPVYRNPAFDNMLPDDAYWAAKIVHAFTDDDIRALVETGEYHDPLSTDYLTRTLIARRDKIVQRYFSRVLPLDRCRVAGGQLRCDDLGVEARLNPQRQLSTHWFSFDNGTGRTAPLAGQGWTVPAAVATAAPGSYFGAEIRDAVAGLNITVYLRATRGALEVVGLDRTWK